MRFTYINFRIENQIAYVELAREEKHNAINYQCFKEIDKVIQTIASDRHIRSVILSGQGEDFCSGIDVKSVFGQPKYALFLLAKWHPFKSNLAQRVSTGWKDLPIPVIAVIHGRCWGAGLQIALGADFRITSPDASLSIMEGRWGLIPDMGGTLALKELLRLDDAKELAMTAKTINGQKAKELGLVSKVDLKPMACAQQFAEELNEQSPDSVAACKKLYNSSWWSSSYMVLARESWYQLKILLGKNYKIKGFNQTHSDEEQKVFKQRSRW